MMLGMRNLSKQNSIFNGNTGSFRRLTINDEIVSLVDAWTIDENPRALMITVGNHREDTEAAKVFNLEFRVRFGTRDILNTSDWIPFDRGISFSVQASHVVVEARLRNLAVAAGASEFNVSAFVALNTSGKSPSGIQQTVNSALGAGANVTFTLPKFTKLIKVLSWDQTTQMTFSINDANGTGIYWGVNPIGQETPWAAVNNGFSITVYNINPVIATAYVVFHIEF